MCGCDRDFIDGGGGGIEIVNFRNDFDRCDRFDGGFDGCGCECGCRRRRCGICDIFRGGRNGCGRRRGCCGERERIVERERGCCFR